MKKIMSIALTLILALSTFAAIAQAGSQTTFGTPEEPIVLTAVLKDMPKNDPTVIKLLATVEEAMAKEGKYIKLDILEIQEGTYADSMGLLLQSGTIPDLIYFQGGDYQFAVTQQILEDMTPYIENSRYIKDVLESHSVAAMKNYPYLLWIAPTRTKVPVVRGDWFAQMETASALEADPTPENYYNFFKELKEKYTSKAAFTVQGATDGLLEIDMFLGQAFGTGQTWVKEGDRYTYSKISASELEKLQYYAKLYSEGLLDPEYLSKKYEAKEQAMYTNEVGLVVATQGAVAHKYNVKNIEQNGEEAAYKILPPAKGEEAWSFSPIDVSKESRGWAIGITSQNKEAAFEYLDFLAGPAGQTIDKLGFEGEEYTIENGHIKLTDKIGAWYPRFHESVAHFEPILPIDPSTPYLTPIAQESYEMVAKYSTNDNAFLIPEEYVIEWDAATSVYNEFAADFIAGKKTADDWDEFVQHWKDMGGQVVVDYANTVLP